MPTCSEKGLIGLRMDSGVNHIVNIINKAYPLSFTVL